MPIVTIEVDRPPGQAIGIKEQLAMELEKYGDTRVVSVKERPAQQAEQTRIPGFGAHR